MRFACAAFGGYRAGKLLDDKEAEAREKQRARQEAVMKRQHTQESALSSFAEAVAAEGAVALQTRQERRQAAKVEKQERQAVRASEKAERKATKAAEKAAWREEKTQKKLLAKRGSEIQDEDRALRAEVEAAMEVLGDPCMEGAEKPLDADLVVSCLADAFDGRSDFGLDHFYEAEAGFGSEMQQDGDKSSSSSSSDASSPSVCVIDKMARNEAKRVEKEAKRVEREEMNAARAKEKEALRAIQGQERQALAAAKARRRKALMDAKAQGREAFREALLECQSMGGLGKQALACAGIDPEGIDVLFFAEGRTPEPGEPHVPGQLVAVDHEKGCVVVAMRGSSCLRDALLDLDCKPLPVTLGSQQGLAHGGMLQAATKLSEPLAVVVEEALGRLPEGSRRVLVVGHSLGAGVAALLTALWHEGGGRLSATEVRCLALACPQVLDANLSLAQSEHTTSLVVGDDCVPCLSLASCFDLRDALVSLADPASRGLDSSFEAARVLEAAQAGDDASLAEKYRTIRQLVGSAPDRLFPAGRIIKHHMGETPRYANHSVVDEMVVHIDMVAGHMPRRYLASVQEIEAAGRCSEPLWSDSSTALSSGLALATSALPSFSMEDIAAAVAATAAENSKL